ncbi:VPLPA-CTERM sorting domain-containing protein [uncultured Roseobacter sp.]|uniref:VPLPA-CTERM sorting domain-containing protein n=1 Tax=uncultured Roseobacter sp. TaxID=114847 RepID=UPI002625F72A|nr:VPLPA-CTERM sorting domain-containing protein [uncultured Roseobacter sp.]
MNSFIKATMLVAGLTVGAAAQAATIDPAAPDSGSFSWGGSTEVFFNGDATLDVTVAENSFITFTATDGFIVGDEFSLVVDGEDVAWDTTGLSGDHFTGSAVIALMAGVTTSIDLKVSAFAPGFTSGGAFWSTSAATPAATVVPLPAGMPLLIAGLGALGVMGRRKNT